VSCNRDGVVSQTAGGALGVGDTEVLQMSARSGVSLWQDDMQVTLQQIPELADIQTALNKAEAHNERNPFVITYDSSGEYKTFGTPGEAIIYAQKTGGATYVYKGDSTHAPSSPRSPVAIFDADGSLMMQDPNYAVDVKASELGAMLDAIEEFNGGEYYHANDSVAVADDCLRIYENQDVPPEEKMQALQDGMDELHNTMKAIRGDS